MTHREIVSLPDGRRQYADGRTYTPLTPEQRKYGVNKPDDPRAVRFHAVWYLPLEVLPDEDREMPVTRSDEEAYWHCTKPRRCKCQVCKRPEADRWKQKWHRDQLRSGAALPSR